MANDWEAKIAEMRLALKKNPPDMSEKLGADQEPYRVALAEWVGVLAQLWTGIGKTPEPDRLKIYQTQLAAVPLGLLELAVSRVMRENTWSVVPPVGAIWQAIRKELGNPYNLETALEEWHPVYPSRKAQLEMFA